MVPYIHIPPLTIGPLSLYPFGALGGLAIIVGSSGFGRRAGRVGLDERVASDIVLWAVIPGFIGAHLYSVIFYFPERILEEPLVLLKLWDKLDERKEPKPMKPKLDKPSVSWEGGSKAEFDSGFTMHKLNGKKTPEWADLQKKLKVMQPLLNFFNTFVKI